MKIKKALFALAVLIYACFSSPTPDNISFTEIAVFVLLVASLKPDISKNNGYALIFAAYGLSIPLFMSLIHGYRISEVMRDVIALLFLVMPVLFYSRGDKETKFLSGLVSLAGIIFSIRSLQSFASDISDPLQWLGTPPGLLYLSNSPEVLFAAVYFLYAALNANNNIWHRMAYGFASCIPILAMATLMQRASLFYVSFCIIIGICGLLWRKPKSATIIVFLVVLLVSFTPFIEEIFHQLSYKTQIVGLNSRGNELNAVINEMSSSTMSLIFGQGWGATFENPAVGGLRVSFTHSLASSLLLKSGLIGVILAGLYFLNLTKRAANFLVQNHNYLLALAGPLFIGLTLYASYKSFGYGLLILIIASCPKGKRLGDSFRPVP